MFVLSLRAKTLKLLCILFVCVLFFGALVSVLPEAGSSLNVNKIEKTRELSKINVKTEKGRVEYLSALGFDVEKKPVEVNEETLPESFDSVLLTYNELQRKQGFDLSKYCGKKVLGYTYTVKAFPDEVRFAKGDYLATIIVYKNKVVAADVVNVSTNEYMPLVTTV